MYQDYADAVLLGYALCAAKSDYNCGSYLPPHLQMNAADFECNYLVIINFLLVERA